jgi:hypothetical protein
MASPLSKLLSKRDDDVAEVDRLLNIFRDDRAVISGQRLAAEEKYQLAMRELSDLEDIDKELGRIEADRDAVDHNLQRHLAKSFRGSMDSFGYGDDDEDDDDDDDDEYKADDEVDVAGGGEQGSPPRPRQRVTQTHVVEPRHREPPSFEVKEGMREALFGYLDAARADEQALEDVYERVKEAGGYVAEDAATKLYDLQKANATSLLKMLKDYHPRTSGAVWQSDPDFQKLAKTLNLIV